MPTLPPVIVWLPVKALPPPRSATLVESRASARVPVIWLAGDTARNNRRRGGGGRRSRADGIRRGRDRLARIQRGKRAAAIGAQANLQPAIRAGEHARAKVERDGEQAVGDGDVEIGQRAADLGWSARGIPDREGQVITAVGGCATGGELALVGQGGGLRERGKPEANGRILTLPP